MFITEKQLADRLQVHVATLRRWRHAGMPHLRMGRSIRYCPEAVEKWLAERWPTDGASARAEALEDEGRA